MQQYVESDFGQTCLCRSISSLVSCHIYCQPHYCVTHFKWVATASQREVFLSEVTILQPGLSCNRVSGRIPSIGSPRTFDPVTCRRPLRCCRCIRASRALFSRLHLLCRECHSCGSSPHTSVLSRCGFFVVDPRPNVVSASSPFSVICNNTTHTNTDTRKHAHTHAQRPMSASGC